jgi:hypothetical protein
MVIPCVGDGLGICQAVPMVSCVMWGAQWLCCVDESPMAGRGLARLPQLRGSGLCAARGKCAGSSRENGKKGDSQIKRHSF